MKYLNDTEAESKKSFAYKKSVWLKSVVAYMFHLAVLVQLNTFL